MLVEAWEMRLVEAHGAHSTLDAQIKDVDAQIEAATAALRKTDAACANCGKPVASDDSFCRSSGESL